jgi:hypothetical protein
MIAHLHEEDPKACPAATSPSTTHRRACAFAVTHLRLVIGVLQRRGSTTGSRVHILILMRLPACVVHRMANPSSQPKSYCIESYSFSMHHTAFAEALLHLLGTTIDAGYGAHSHLPRSMHVDLTQRETEEKARQPET